MKNTRFLWFMLTLAFVVLTFVTDFQEASPRRPPAQKQWAPEPKPKFGDQRADNGPIRRWLLKADTERNRSTGTAFAIGNGLWLTARHVVDHCDSLWVIKQGKKKYADKKVQSVTLHPSADIALFHLPLAADHPPVLTTEHELRKGTSGFHFGFPGGEPGDVFSFFLGDSAATVRGAGGSTFPIQVWATREIPSRLSSLGGLSGGPAFDDTGRVIGVTIAESPRRGRVATTPPPLSGQMIELADAESRFASSAPSAIPVKGLMQSSYSGIGDELRDELSVIQLYCHVRIPGRPSKLDGM